MARRLGEPTPIAAWDWRYLAEKVRREQFDLDDAQLKPYFALDPMIAAMFDCAGRLFGLQVRRATRRRRCTTRTCGCGRCGAATTR